MDNKTDIENKDYDRCCTCNSYLLYRSTNLDVEGNFVSLDLNGKRHFCNAAERIWHEEHVLNDLKKRLAFANRVELSSIQLELIEETNQTPGETHDFNSGSAYAIR